MTKRSRCIHIVAIACLLLFVQCNTQTKLSEEIEALKQQLQETNRTNIGNLDTIIQGVRNEAQNSSTQQTQELGKIRTSIESLNTTIQEVKNEAQNSSTQQTQELDEVRANVRSLDTIIQGVRNEAQNSSTQQTQELDEVRADIGSLGTIIQGVEQELNEILPLRGEVMELTKSSYELFQKLRKSLNTQEDKVGGKDIVGDRIFDIYCIKDRLEAREEEKKTVPPLEVSADTDNDAVSEVSR